MPLGREGESERIKVVQWSGRGITAMGWDGTLGNARAFKRKWFL